ncbi:universal stress protein [Bacillus carboniphilus]|uniref:Universal stress protein n=1 Tax=Bacillus carboniphilus TaxID=86663 RepID=A0ABY9JVA3_9BACI|nr:universal stress protein [Bacillus carboniphilus]WLR43315.1 universal stress protein [Bacillus carboniphilus]
MFSKLLLSIDGSEHSKRAAEHAADLIKKLNLEQINIIHVFQKAPTRSKIAQYDFHISDLLYEECITSFRDVFSLFEQHSITYKLEVALGDPAKEILSYADSIKSDCIIMGSRGLNALNEVLLGSVSHKILHDSSCPVLLIK